MITVYWDGEVVATYTDDGRLISGESVAPVDVSPFKARLAGIEPGEYNEGGGESFAKAILAAYDGTRYVAVKT